MMSISELLERPSRLGRHESDEIDAQVRLQQVRLLYSQLPTSTGGTMVGGGAARGGDVGDRADQRDRRLVRLHGGEPGLALLAVSALAAHRHRARRHRPRRELLGARVAALGLPVGPRDAALLHPRLAGLPGLPVRADLRGHLVGGAAHRGASPVVLRVRPPGAGADRRAQHHRGRAGAHDARVHRRRGDDRAPDVRPELQPRAGRVAPQPVRERGARAQARDAEHRARAREGGGRARAHRRRDREPLQDPVLRRRRPRPAAAAARDGTLRRRAHREGARPRSAAGREQHQRLGRRARGALQRAARHLEDRFRRAQGEPDALRARGDARSHAHGLRARGVRARPAPADRADDRVPLQRSGAGRADPAQPRFQRAPLHARRAACSSARGAAGRK